jgi:hypothetical protein
MGFSSVSGAVSPRIAALVHFGFLNRTGEGYELSEDSRSITDSINEQERAEAIRMAFSKPTLYQEILSKFGGDGKIPSQLATHLHRFHGITDAASTAAADIFIASGRFAGVLDQESRIVSALAPASADQSNPLDSAASLESRDSVAVRIPAQSAPIPRMPLPLPANPGATQKFEFAITRGRAVVLVVPSDLNAKDIKVIRKQVELLELQAGLEEAPE